MTKTLALSLVLAGVALSGCARETTEVNTVDPIAPAAPVTPVEPINDPAMGTGTMGQDTMMLVPDEQVPAGARTNTVTEMPGTTTGTGTTTTTPNP